VALSALPALHLARRREERAARAVAAVRLVNGLRRKVNA
jgi:hypothetical protein